MNWIEPPLTATSDKRHFFVLTDSPYIDSCSNLFTTATASKACPQTAEITSQQRPFILATDEKVKNGHKSMARWW